MSEIKDLQESILQKLKNISVSKGIDYTNILTRYGVERFLYRLSISEYRNDYILKGATLFLIWGFEDIRATKDMDFSGYGDSDSEHVKKSVL